jgi:transcriptional regulator of acetoin/glycerol metabolism
MKASKVSDDDIMLAIVKARGVLSNAAPILGISRITLWRLIGSRGLGDRVDEVRVSIANHGLEGVPKNKTVPSPWPLISQYAYAGQTDMVLGMLRVAIEKARGDLRKAGRLLGISRSSAYNYVERYQLRGFVAATRVAARVERVRRKARPKGVGQPEWKGRWKTKGNHGLVEQNRP